MKKKLCS